MVVVCSSQMGHAALWRSQPKESVFAVVQHSMPKVSKQYQLHLNIKNCLVRYTTFNKADVLIKQLVNIDLNHLAVLFQSGWGAQVFACVEASWRCKRQAWSTSIASALAYIVPGP